MALGSLSLNLALPDSFPTSLPQTLASLVPTSTTLDLSIASLNDKNNRLAPRSRDESLESGRLQLASGTAVVVDLRGIGEGKLEDTGASPALPSPPATLTEGARRTGVRNLRHVATTVAQQKLSYEFPFSSFELETDLNFILLSEGKAIVPVRSDFSRTGKASADEVANRRSASSMSSRRRRTQRHPRRSRTRPSSTSSARSSRRPSTRLSTSPKE